MGLRSCIVRRQGNSYLRTLRKPVTVTRLVTHRARELTGTWMVRRTETSVRAQRSGGPDRKNPANLDPAQGARVLLSGATNECARILSARSD